MNKPLWGILGLILFVELGLVSMVFPLHEVNPSEGGLNYGSSVCIHKNGELIDCKPNTLTDIGKEMIETLLTTTNGAVLDTIALCNSTNVTGDGGGDGCEQPQAGDTYLDGEYYSCGLARAAGSLADQGTGNFSYAHTFTATCDGLMTNVTALYNKTGAVGSTYFAGNNFTGVTLDTDDQLTVTWYVWVN